jgi:gamma-tubulin complex component 2
MVLMTKRHLLMLFTVPWSPQASIIPQTTAPLATRISVPPLAKSAPQSLQSQPLSQISPEQQEKAIVEDLLYVFMGVEGQYIHYEGTYDPLEEKDRLFGPSFQIMPGLDPSLRDLTMSMLRTPKYFIAVETFLEVMSRGEHGVVNHALCAAIRVLQRNYMILIAQLEMQFLNEETLTLHRVNLSTKQAGHIMFQLYNLGIELLKANAILDSDDDDSLDDSDNLENILESLKEGGTPGLASKKTCKGGSTLGLITKRLNSMSGDPQARSLLSSLLREASKPYMRMLNEWLHHGGIRDPHSEFLIKEQKSIKRERLDQDYTDEYWEKRYTIRENLIPPQLEGVKDKVLLAGKYLNVVRECGGVDLSEGVKDVPLSFEDPRFLENVHSAYAFANASLLNLLLTTHALPTRLRSLKHYFFLDRADWFTYFLELGTSELKKPVRDVNTGKLQSLLDIVLRQPGSVAADDPYKDDVKVVMNETLLTDWLMKIVSVTGLDQDSATGAMGAYTPAAPATVEKDASKISGFETLVLDYVVPFPLSLVVSRVTLTRYQLLFRYLVSLRHLENLLISAWAEQSRGSTWRHKSSNARQERAKKRAFTLRARMLIFVQQLIYYCTTEVIEPNWTNLMGRLNQGQSKGSNESSTDETSGVKRTVDELMQDHVDFLATCLKECMLTNSKLLKVNCRNCRQYSSSSY